MNEENAYFFFVGVSLAWSLRSRIKEPGSSSNLLVVFTIIMQAWPGLIKLYMKVCKIKLTQKKSK